MMLRLVLPAASGIAPATAPIRFPAAASNAGVDFAPQRPRKAAVK